MMSVERTPFGIVSEIASGIVRWLRPASPVALAVVLAIVLGLVAALPAAAAGDPSALFLGLPAWIWMTLNLAIFVGLLWYLLAPPISRFLEQRAEGIRENLRAAREQRAEVDDLQGTLEGKIAALEAEIEQVRERAVVEGEREHEAILQQAERERERIMAQAGNEIDHRVAMARQDLKDFTAGLAADLTRRQLEERVGPEERRRQFDASLTRLEDRRTAGETS